MARGQSLYDWCQENGEWGQQLMDEWVGLDENDNPVEMSEITYGSKKKVKWKCTHCKYTWNTTVLVRTYSRSGCPICKGSIISEKNSLKSWCDNNGEFGKKF